MLEGGAITSNTVGSVCGWVIELGDIDKIGVHISYIIITVSLHYS